MAPHQRSGIIIENVFTTDPTLRSTPATWHGRLHDLSFVLLGVFMLLSMLGLGRAFQNDARWRRFGLYTFVTAACALPSFALKGIAFYLFLGAILTWSVTIAIQLLRLSDMNLRLRKNTDEVRK